MAYTNPGPAVATTIHPQGVTSNQAIRLLAVFTGVNVNATGDVAVLPIANTTNFSVSNVVFTNASVSLTTAAAGLFTAPAAVGSINVLIPGEGIRCEGNVTANCTGATAVVFYG